MNEKTRDAVLVALNEVAEAEGTVNFAVATEIAEKFEVKPRAVVAIATRNDVPYARKERTRKDGSAIVSKADLVTKIAEGLGVEVETLDGLDKANKTALEVLAENVG